MMTNIQDMPDEQIVGRVRKEDKELYREIIRRYQKRLTRYAEYLTGDRDKAADVVQETFIKAYININSFNTKKKFSSWMYRIAHNEAINMISRRKNTVSMPEDRDFDSGIDLEDDFIRRELEVHTRRCLDRMSILYSEPLTLYYLEDKSYAEISDILRIPIGTVGIRIRRAKQIMKKICRT